MTHSRASARTTTLYTTVVTHEAKMCKKFAAVVGDPAKEALLQCGCGEGPQDAWHFWEECKLSQPIRDTALAASNAIALEGGAMGWAAWTGMEPGKRRVLMVSARRGAGLQGDLEDRIVAAAARVWVEGAPAVCEQYRVMNAGWKDSMGPGPAGT